MKELREYILQFGYLNKHEIELINSKVQELVLHKGDFFRKREKYPARWALWWKALCGAFTSMREKKLRAAFNENNLVVDYINFEANAASSEYLQACTYCKLIVFSKQHWEELSHTIMGWARIKNKMLQTCMYQKSRKGPVISQDATTRYREFLKNYPSLLNRISLTYIASYLGVTPQSLSRIRKNVR